MKGNGINPDTLEGVITALERVRDTWRNDQNSLEYPDLRDAIIYLKEYQTLLERPRLKKLIDVLQEVRGEK